MPTDEAAPPRLPCVFITADTDPLNRPPMSMLKAHETATVSSSAARATVNQNRLVTADSARTPGSKAIADNMKPHNETITLPRRTSFHLRQSRSETHPPATLVTVAPSRGALDARPICIAEKCRA